MEHWVERDVDTFVIVGGNGAPRCQETKVARATGRRR